jgi:transketolase
MQTIYDKEYDFVIGKALVPREGKDAAIIATGIGVSMAYEAAVTLENEGMHIKVLDMHTIKPIDKDAIITAAKTGAIITVEDHNISGGLGSAVAEVLGEAGISIKFKKLGIPDVWAMNGSPDDLYGLYGFDASGIKSAVKELLK